MLINSKWLLKSFSISESTACIVFQENGVLVAYEDSTDIKAGEDGEVHEWRYEHDELILNYNNGYCTYRGTVISDNYIGKASNQDGFEWTFEAKLLLDKPSQQQPNLSGLVMNYQWLLKAYFDKDFKSPANDNTDRYLSFKLNGSLEYLDPALQSLPFAKKDSWVLLDNRIVVRVNWTNTQYVSYVFVYRAGQIVGKAKNNRRAQVWYVMALPYRRVEDLEELPSDREVVFHDTSFTHQKINSVGEYHKYWLIRDERRNPDFDVYSNDILCLKITWIGLFKNFITL